MRNYHQHYLQVIKHTENPPFTSTIFLARNLTGDFLVMFLFQGNFDPCPFPRLWPDAIHCHLQVLVVSWVNGGFNGKIIQVHDGLKQLQCLIIGGHRKPLSFQLFIENSLHPTLGNESYSWSTHVSSFLMLENSPLWCLKTCETGWWQWSARGALKSTLFLEDLGDMVRCSWLPQVATVPSYSSVSCKIRGAQLTPGNKLWMIPQEG
jgi:hypothetical protein